MRDDQSPTNDEEVARLRRQLRGANDKYRAAMANERQLNERIIEISAQVRQLHNEIALRNDLEGDLIRISATARLALGRLRARRAVRLAQAIGHARSPRLLFGLPVAVARAVGTRGEAPSENEVRAQLDKEIEQWRAKIVDVRSAIRRKPGERPVEQPTVDGERRARRRERTLASLAATKRPRVAVIVDDFTGAGVDPEWETIHLTPQGWRGQLEEGDPQLLFVESAWRGIDNLWSNTVGHVPPELLDILAWCAEHGVPTAFWNKEDPVHFSTFLNVASRFEHVFTTDIEMIPRYRETLGHEQVWLMPFAAQPRLHNPVADAPRKNAMMFAGAYYRRYPDRNRDLESLVSHVSSVVEVEIFDRNLHEQDENYKFPDSYLPLIKGTLSPDSVHHAYRAYEYGLNLNSVKQSATMFARRVFELMASGTLIVGNYSRGVRMLFGNLTTSVDAGEEAAGRIQELESDPRTSRRLRQAALRKVLQEHTYADRIEYLVSRIMGSAYTGHLPKILVVAEVRSHEELLLFAAQAETQLGVDVVPVAVSPDESVVARLTQAGGPRIFSRADLRQLKVADLAPTAEFAAVWTMPDHHGRHLLLDLALAHRYSDRKVVGIAGGYEWTVDGVRERGGQRYGDAPIGSLRTPVVRVEDLGENAMASSLLTLDGLALGAFATDIFGYCQVPRGMLVDAEAVAAEVEAEVRDAGVDMQSLYARAESLDVRLPFQAVTVPVRENVAVGFAGFARAAVLTRELGDGVEVVSTLAPGTHDYLFSRETHAIADVSEDGDIRLHVECQPGLNTQVAVIYYDEEHRRSGSSVHFTNQNATSTAPDGAKSLRLALRVAGEGSAILKSAEFAHRATAPSFMQMRGQAIVVTNVYPSHMDRYRNGFVHSRVLAYKDAGLDVDVLSVSARRSYETFVHEGVDVHSGSIDLLERALEVSDPGAPLLVHFLDESMWDVIRRAGSRRRVIVWLHGAEVQPWWRRSYNYTTDEDLDRAKGASDARMAFWQRVFLDRAANTHFVFVSKYFANEVMQDVGVTLEGSRYSIIHNPVDTNLFSYEEKSAEDRLRILSVRPYASPKYANDLSVAAVELLRDEPEFERMEFMFVGDGPHFESTVQPLRGLSNVTLDRRFLSHREIADLHKRSGVFLVPTRMDAQGVSRDEAMSSGLVPVTTRVAAVPEFVDERSGILCEPESASSLAAAIIELVRDPEMFLRLSAGAAERVRAQVAGDLVVQAELTLVGGSDV
ncbi:hypothetical protein ASE27_02640 [Oerskovia sp. Root918]|uniref:glycosyltransferase family protein n=1 Tax=Oerskovia sp. Root918 TaxID=1736607 RepID=UPI0006FEAD43|nr:glycosyltransferase [Oerskovia sp. Root918]KRD47286.1 hypothetical protein ASE27_02640 [Oerskovia sp. Root918]